MDGISVIVRSKVEQDIALVNSLGTVPTAKRIELLPQFENNIDAWPLEFKMQLLTVECIEQRKESVSSRSIEPLMAVFKPYASSRVALECNAVAPTVVAMTEVSLKIRSGDFQQCDLVRRHHRRNLGQHELPRACRALEQVAR